MAELGGRARDLVRDGPPSAEKAIVLASFARHFMLGGNFDDTTVAEEALALSETLALDEVSADVLVTLGTARAFGGDPSGAADIRRALDAALAGNFLTTAIRAYSNLASFDDHEGDLRASADLARLAEAAAQRLGSRRQHRWTRGNRVFMLMAIGDWDECGHSVEEVLADSATPTRITWTPSRTWPAPASIWRAKESTPPSPIRPTVWPVPAA